MNFHEEICLHSLSLWKSFCSYYKCQIFAPCLHWTLYNIISFINILSTNEHYKINLGRKPNAWHCLSWHFASYVLIRSPITISRSPPRASNTFGLFEWVLVCLELRVIYSNSSRYNIATMSKAAKKVLDEAKESGNPELELQDKQIVKIEDLPGLCEYLHHGFCYHSLTKNGKYYKCSLCLWGELPIDWTPKCDELMHGRLNTWFTEIWLIQHQQTFKQITNSKFDNFLLMDKMKMTNSDQNFHNIKNRFWNRPQLPGWQSSVLGNSQWHNYSQYRIQILLGFGN